MMGTWQRARSLMLSLGAVVLGAGPVQAHHSFSMFDNTQCLTLHGTVRNFMFTYPHIWLWMLVPDAQGKPEIWGFEGASPSEHKRYSNWTMTSLKPGDQITMQYIPLKDGRHGGSLQNITLEDGSTLKSPMQMCGHALQPRFGAPPGGPTGAPPAGGTP